MDTNATRQSLHVSSIVDTGNAIDVFSTNAPTPRNAHAMRTRTKSGIFKPKAFYITITIPTPTSYTEASKYPEWQNAMCEEFNTLQAQVARHKARLVAKGYHKETVYMSQPTGFQDKTCPNHVCLLHKSLYGLKQAPRAWFECFTSYLYDIIVTGPDFSYISLLKTQLALEFQISDLGPLKYFLGLKIHSLPNSLFVNQAKYLNDLLHTLGMISAKSYTTPMSPSLDLYTTAPPFNDPSLYRKLVGSLQYLTFTCPDIVFSLNRVILLIDAPPPDSLPSLALIQSPGLLKSNLQSPVLPQKQNIILSPLLLLIFNGYNNFYVISVFL
ncbi:putative mitochondrial protein [Cucumis melo var. makuwa]|uniref:Mitochondrial protein n=1 Tax=Cucumis melo var. makuwa TaxID=1194695 RepID=A0A5D3DCL6_CUCMM|nr:putative mitochondrial protein [Cucumis melo var. makuwa]TYK21313.1 putative mitochondrial protein [Cucumis melo var. makuwa]